MLCSHFSAPWRPEKPGFVVVAQTGPRDSYLSAPRLDRHPPPVERANITRVRSDETILPHLFENMSGPASHPRDGECRGEHLGLEPHTVQDERGVELHIGLEAAPRLELLENPEHHFFDDAGILVELLLTGAGEELTGGLIEDVGARVSHLVDAMTEAHDPPSGGDHLPRPGFGFHGDGLSRCRRARPNLEDHVERRPGRSAVKRSF